MHRPLAILLVLGPTLGLPFGAEIAGDGRSRTEVAGPGGAAGTPAAVSDGDPSEAPGPATSLPAPTLAAPPEVELRAIRRAPLAHLGRTVRVALQLGEERERWNPLDGRFGPGEWRGFRAWGDGELVFEPEVHADPAPWLFVRRGTADDEVLAAARPHQRYAAQAHVREVVLGEPWIEVRGLERLPEELGAGAVLHAAKALRYLEAGRPDLARPQLERARAGRIPPFAREALDALLERARE